RKGIAGLHAEWFTPEDPAKGKIILYLHGGAYIMGNCATHRQLVSYLSRACNVRAVLPEYRLAPEHPYPAAIDDALSAYRALRDEGYGPGDIFVAGDSAGGGLTMALLLSLRDAGEPMPAGALLLSPWLDLTASGESMVTRADRDPWFKPGDMSVIAAYYCKVDEFREPRVSPVFADVSGLPPIFIQVGDDEILLSDSKRMASKLEAAGSEVTLEIWPEMWHVFQVFVHQMPESREALRQTAPFVREKLGLKALSEA
ncbi:MAG: alpha/beta hydrolase, partial [Gammaproteobacteria bacterium]|nr:alpha/beta hydrolase [Gammaproteobacteria bacterium]